MPPSLVSFFQRCHYFCFALLVFSQHPITETGSLAVPPCHYFPVGMIESVFTLNKNDAGFC